MKALLFSDQILSSLLLSTQKCLSLEIKTWQHITNADNLIVHSFIVPRIATGEHSKANPQIKLSLQLGEGNWLSLLPI